MKFELNEKEEKRYKEFRDKRYKKHRARVKKTGKEEKFSVTVCFTPTGIGDHIMVKCSDGKEVDITDYDCW